MPKKLEVKHDTEERVFEVEYVQSTLPFGYEAIEEQEARWGEERNHEAV